MRDALKVLFLSYLCIPWKRAYVMGMHGKEPACHNANSFVL